MTKLHRATSSPGHGTIPAMPATLVEQWDAIVAAQPSDWSSLFLELRLRDAVQAEECALVMSPLNPWHEGDWRSGVFHFRAAHTYGYGAAAQLVRKRLGTMDEVGIVATLRLERRLSDVRPVSTQGVT
jgi:hypothetical protein